MEQGTNAGATASPLVDLDTICRRIRAALEPARAHAVSLHDERGDVLWLSESSMGPDEHDAVHGALAKLGAPNGPGIVIADLGDGRSAALIRVIGDERLLVGVVMIVLDARVIRPGHGDPARLMTPAMRQALVAFAAARSMQAPAPSADPPPRPAAAPRTTVAPRPAVTPRQAVAPRPAVAQVPPTLDRLNAALRQSAIQLYVQRLVPLVRGSQLTRYEVLMRSGDPGGPNAAPAAMIKSAVEHGFGSMLDRRVITDLIGWLVRHPQIWRDGSAQFSVNLTATALKDEHFLKFVELCLAKAGLSPGLLGFEVDAATAARSAGRMQAIARTLERLRCPLALDDFALRTECLELLRLPGVRTLKLEGSLTAAMRVDKLAQASIAATVQLARVLGMHTVAKRSESAADNDWLNALGIDFVQSHALAAPAPLDSLTGAPAPGGGRPRP